MQPISSGIGLAVDDAMRNAMLREMTKTWMEAGANPSLRTVREWMEGATDEELADACIEGWGLDCVWPGAQGSWVDVWHVTREDLAQAFAEHRKRVGAK